MMDSILDHIMLKKHNALDEDTMRHELRIRGYVLDHTAHAVMQGVSCKHCEHLGLKGEVWKKITATKPKIQSVTYSFYYCPECWRVGVHG